MKQVNVFRPTIIIGVLVALCVGYIAQLFYFASSYSSELITADIAELVQVFKKIDTDCGIVSFDFQKNPINFLNVKSFAGSEVGPMNLAYPEKWQGPYMQDNPTMQAIEYQVVRTGDGYFITPGDGVELPNGKKIGTDIKLDESADIPALITQEHGLRDGKRVFAAPLLGPAPAMPDERLGELINE